MTIQAEYLVDEKGHKKSVVLSIKTYEKLLNYLEDLEDAVDLKLSKKTAKAFVDSDQLAQRLKSQRRIR
ncbi:MAG: hypothetical protein HQL15_09710 [Candidatus Omnitrophica bacterium]|nr:hypothetical protein [Candidatus Omnitrophota bacterium]